MIVALDENGNLIRTENSASKKLLISVSHKAIVVMGEYGSTEIADRCPATENDDLWTFRNKRYHINGADPNRYSGVHPIGNCTILEVAWLGWPALLSGVRMKGLSLKMALFPSLPLEPFKECRGFRSTDNGS